jgi:DNA-binding LacI/PurR family transcriptional regulator
MAILFDQTANYNSLDILRGINGVLRFHEDTYRLVLFDTFHTDSNVYRSLERRALEILEHEDMSGAIISPVGGAETLPIFRHLQEKGIPLVFVDRYPMELTCDFVGVDNFGSAREAVQHLLNLGHRRIAHLSTRPVWTVLERERGYREALQAAGITPPPEWVYSANHEDDAEEALDQFLGLDEPPTAVFAVTDYWAHVLLTKAEARGYRVPQDLSIVGFDNVERYSLRPPILTTQYQPFDQIGSRAVQLLMERVNGKGMETLPPQHILLPTELIVRSSCAPPPSAARSKS